MWKYLLNGEGGDDVPVEFLREKASIPDLRRGGLLSYCLIICHYCLCRLMRKCLRSGQRAVHDILEHSSFSLRSHKLLFIY